MPSFISRQFILLSLVASIPVFASAAPLSITVENIADEQGTIRLGVYNEAGYTGGGAVTGIDLTVEGTSVTGDIEGLQPGTYAIKLFHDVDDDGDMKTGMFGIPKEPYAFSNNARGRMGPADWNDARFEVTEEGARQVISLK